jgi:hypothetical protein
MVAYAALWSSGQAESSLPAIAGEELQKQNGQQPSALGERLRQRTLSANVRAAERFFERNLPPGWVFTASEKRIELRRLAPVFTLAVQPIEYLTNSKHSLLSRAKQAGKRHNCTIEFKVERHDDNALMRQKLRLYQEIRRDIEKSYERLELRRRCAGVTLEECSKIAGRTGEAAREYLATRNILIQKLEVTPLYRIGTLYLFPQKNQCVTAEYDWYYTNTEYPGDEALFPLEAREEIEIILKNLEQLKLSQ